MSSDLTPIRPFRAPTFGDRTYRALLGDDGREWIIYTIPAANYDRRAGLSLLFESADVMRRIRVFPDNWYELSDADLFAICLHPGGMPSVEPADSRAVDVPASDSPVDRRWRPDRDGGEWERTTRHAIFEAIRRCISHALHGSAPGGAHAREPELTDAVFHELHICAEAYSRALYSLGHTPASAEAVIVAAARSACAPTAAPESVVAALGRWCREAEPGPATSQPGQP